MNFHDKHGILHVSRKCSFRRTAVSTTRARPVQNPLSSGAWRTRVNPADVDGTAGTAALFFTGTVHADSWLAITSILTGRISVPRLAVGWSFVFIREPNHGPGLVRIGTVPEIGGQPNGKTVSGISPSKRVGKPDGRWWFSGS
jgi:hypothetical protein